MCAALSKHAQGKTLSYHLRFKMLLYIIFFLWYIFYLRTPKVWVEFWKWKCFDLLVLPKNEFEWNEFDPPYSLLSVLLSIPIYNYSWIITKTTNWFRLPTHCTWAIVWILCNYKQFVFWCKTAIVFIVHVVEHSKWNPKCIVLLHKFEVEAAHMWFMIFVDFGIRHLCHQSKHSFFTQKKYMVRNKHTQSFSIFLAVCDRFVVSTDRNEKPTI